ncbi:MAG: HAMP domain-containing sensor histidine kinase, partial [Verrucomicrobiota bacterium]
HKQFLFADHLVLDESPTRDFYRELLRGLAHKNNNVLAVVQGFSSLILMDQGLDEDLVDSVKQMRNSAQSSSRLSERILTAGGVARVSAQPLQLNGFFSLLEGRLQEMCDASGATMSLRLQPEMGEVMADSSRLRKMIYELVTNAAEAAGDSSDGHVEIELGDAAFVGMEDDSRLHLLIRNNGATISEEKLPQVFGPFFTTKGSRHFGVGLTSAGVVAGQMKMRLGIASQRDETTAWLAMPIHG